MIESLVVIVLVGGFLYFKYRLEKERQRQADFHFKAIMYALEEKAKREGTFKQSYFGDNNGS